DWLKKLFPVLGFMRFPVKFVVLATFVIPLLAAHGLSWLQGVPAERWPREWRQTKCLALGLLGLMAVIVGVAWKYPLLKGDIATTAGNALLRAVFLVTILGCVSLLRRETDLKLQRLLQTGLVLLLWFDVFTHTSNLSPTAARAVLKPDAIRQFFQWDTQLQAGV